MQLASINNPTLTDLKGLWNKNTLTIKISTTICGLFHSFLLITNIFEPSLERWQTSATKPAKKCLTDICFVSVQFRAAIITSPLPFTALLWYRYVSEVMYCSYYYSYYWEQFDPSRPSHGDFFESGIKTIASFSGNHGSRCWRDWNKNAHCVLTKNLVSIHFKEQ